MTSLVVWEPFREMRRVMDRMLGEAFAHPLATYALYESVPAVDMYQTDDEVVVKATLPGVKPDDIQVSITGEVLTIRGEINKASADGSNHRRYHIRERAQASFSRSLTLPTAVVADKAKAVFENGILTLRIPKADEVRPRTITVKAK